MCVSTAVWGCHGTRFPQLDKPYLGCAPVATCDLYLFHSVPRSQLPPSGGAETHRHTSDRTISWVFGMRNWGILGGQTHGVGGSPNDGARGLSLTLLRCPGTAGELSRFAPISPRPRCTCFSRDTVTPRPVASLLRWIRTSR